MSEIKTVTHDGQVYEIGKDYLFGSYKKTMKLIHIDSLSAYPFRVFEGGHDNGYKRIYLGNAECGTITPAPIELVGDAAYMFCLETTWVGFYRVSRKSFFDRLVGGNKICGLAEVTNIRLMTVESK